MPRSTKAKSKRRAKKSWATSDNPERDHQKSGWRNRPLSARSWSRLTGRDKQTPDD